MTDPSQNDQNPPDRKGDQTGSDDADLVETVTSAVKGEDKPMGKSHPKSPFAIIFFTYPVVLIAGLIILALLYWFFGGIGGGGAEQ